MTKEEAKELSIKKWQYVLDHFDEIEENNRTLEDITHDAERKYGLSNLTFDCPYCELFIKKIKDNFGRIFLDYKESCKGCPISLPEDYPNVDKMLHCAHPDHEWCIMDETQTRESVEDLLNLIKNS